MDVHCSTCGEAWEAYHLQHKAIFHTNLTKEQAEMWLLLPREEKLSERYRELFRAVGLEFGNSVLHVKCCPCCPTGTLPNVDVEAVKSAIVERLGGEESAIALAFKEANRVRLL